MRDRSQEAAGFSRRRLLTTGLGALGAVGAGRLALAAHAEESRGGDVLAAPVGGSTEPSAILWLDKNGSHNQSSGPGMDPSNIFHFKGASRARTTSRAPARTGEGIR
jgi:hypothetical protein